VLDPEPGAVAVLNIETINAHLVTFRKRLEYLAANSGDRQCSRVGEGSPERIHRLERKNRLR
jgi:hypothetical protein